MSLQPLYHGGHQRGRTDNKRRNGFRVPASPPIHGSFKIFATRMHLYFDMHLPHRCLCGAHDYVGPMRVALVYLNRKGASKAPEHAINCIDGVVVPSLLPLCFGSLFWCHKKSERKQSANGDPERTRNRADVLQRGVPFSSLNTSEVGRVNPGTAGKFLLGPTVLHSKASDAIPKRPSHRERAFFQGRFLQLFRRMRAH
jgi:hypothetical protein